eukprot:24030_1
MSWYYVDPSGETKGPVSKEQIKSAYGSTIKDTTYIWNGTSVEKWSPVTKVPEIWNMLKTQRVFQEDEKQADYVVDESIKTVINTLNAQLSHSRRLYNKSRLRNIFDITPEKLINKQSPLNKQIAIYEQNVAEIIVLANSFSKHLQNTKAVMKELSTINPVLYKNWNAPQMSVWIEGLENGRFKKYCDILRKGFIEGGITGKDLPDVHSGDLSSAPFNIKNFRDKKDLEAHFKSLKSQKNNEGTMTEWI